MELNPDQRDSSRFSYEAAIMFENYASGRVLLEHDRGFVTETRSVSLVGVGLHLTPSLRLHAKSFRMAVLNEPLSAFIETVLIN